MNSLFTHDIDLFIEKVIIGGNETYECHRVNYRGVKSYPRGRIILFF